MKVTLDVSNRTMALVAGGVLCFGAGTVIATGFPTESTALHYSGVLTDSTGAPLSTTATISVRLFDAAANGDVQCSATQSNVPLGETDGRFRVPLPTACVDAIRDVGDLWAEVSVGATTLPRQKLGAVPFAVSASEAQHAVTADAADIATTVAPSGVSAAAIQDGAVSSAKLAPALATSISEQGSRLAALESPPESSRRYVVATLASQTPPANVSTVLQFASTTSTSLTPGDMDLTNERFVASVPGAYAFTLQVAADQWHGTRPLIAVNCAGATGHYSAAEGNSRNNGGAARGTWFFLLEAGDSCQARIVMVDMTTQVTLDIDPFRSFLEVIRISP